MQANTMYIHMHARTMYIHIHVSVRYKSLMGIAQVCIGDGLDKQKVRYPLAGIWFLLKKERNSDTCCARLNFENITLSD